MEQSRECALLFTAREQAELLPMPRDCDPLGPKEVVGKTLVSLVSSGTEVRGLYAGSHHEIRPESYPIAPGYASVFQVEKVGKDVERVKVGDVVFSCGKHRSYQRTHEGNIVKLPEELPPEVAVFARMVKISMPAFVHTSIRPPEKVLVMGLGVVGLLAAQLAELYGYEVIACEPNEQRREIAKEHGIRTVLASIPIEEAGICRQVGLGIDCSGHEQAVLDLCHVVRERGEVFLVGVPWTPGTDMLAQEILHAVFYNYVNLRSGWEGRMPTSPNIHSPHYHFTAALRWLAEGKVEVHQNAYRKVPPSNPQEQYQAILHNRLDALTVTFDWREL